MFDTVENTHNKIVEKITLGKTALAEIARIVAVLQRVVAVRTGKKYTEITQSLNSLCVNLLADRLDEIENNYQLSVIVILTDYYTDGNDEVRNTKDYYRAVTSENVIAGIDGVIGQVRGVIDSVHKVYRAHVMSKTETRDAEYELDTVSKTVDRAAKLDIRMQLEKRNYEMCKCGTRMTVVPELSELHCTAPECGLVKSIDGVVFRDDQFYPQEGQKTKHGGYDESRHNKFWMERIQALESKVFPERTVSNIDYVLTRDGYVRSSLTCERMREILKDPIVNATDLNEHASLLVKMFGGPPPPQLDFMESRIEFVRFNKAMELYNVVNPGYGNKPYYPYFIYKILEYMFRDSDKIRILNYIHLQSRDTVVKNDKFFEKMCALADPLDGLVYEPTDPCGRV